MYLVHVPLEKSLTTEYNAFVVSFCSRFEKTFFFSRELTISNLWQNEYFMSSLCSYVCSKPSLELRSGCHSSWSPCIFPCISASIEHLGMSKHNLPKHPVWEWVRLGQSLSHQGPLFQDDDVIWPVLLKSFIPGLLCSEVHSTPGMLGKPFPQVTHPVFRFLHL